MSLFNSINLLREIQWKCKQKSTINLRDQNDINFDARFVSNDGKNQQFVSM